MRGVAYRPKGGFGLSLREDPEVARGISGFDPFAILLRDKPDVEAWARRLDDLGVQHSPIIEAAIGWILASHDPDGMELRFYTEVAHDKGAGLT